LFLQGFKKACTLFAGPGLVAPRAPKGGHSSQVEESMFRANKNNVHADAVCIVNDGAAARCALGLLVVVILLLSN
jgi:hypothetical protein